MEIKLHFLIKGGEELDIISYGTFFNAFVRSNAEHTRGICNQEFIKSKIL